MKNKKRIAFDFDGVIANIITPMREHFLINYKYDINNCKTYDIIIPNLERSKITKEIVSCLSLYNDFIFPYDDVVDILWKVYNLTGYINLITARDILLRQDTINWWKKHKLPPTNMIFCNMDRKKHYIQEHDIDIWVDDRLKTANDISEYVEKVYLLNRYWNYDRPTKVNVYRIDSLKEIIL